MRLKNLLGYASPAPTRLAESFDTLVYLRQCDVIFNNSTVTNENTDACWKVNNKL